jgi:hypothetical protein
MLHVRLLFATDGGGRTLYDKMVERKFLWKVRVSRRKVYN